MTDTTRRSFLGLLGLGGLGAACPWTIGSGTAPHTFQGIPVQAVPAPRYYFVNPALLKGSDIRWVFSTERGRVAYKKALGCA